MKPKLAMICRMALLALLALLWGGCAHGGFQTTEAAQFPDLSVGNGGEPVEKEALVDIGDRGLSDKETLYAQGDPWAVQTLYLTVRQGNEGENTDHTWQDINAYSIYDYQEMGIEPYKAEAILQVGDEKGPLPGELGFGLRTPNATVQVRGQTSSTYAQKNYKIRVKKEMADDHGQRTIALNKHLYDSLRIRNKLCFDLMTEIPNMMSLRTQFVHLYVKDETISSQAKFEDYGLYTQVEQLNQTALRAHGADPNGQLYKINFFEFQRNPEVIRLKDQPGYDLAKFEECLEIKGNDDHSKLIEMLEAVNDYHRPIEEVCSQYFDMDNLLTWMAFHILMGNTDTQSRNFYIYSPLNSSKWYFWSWDNDGALNQTTARLRGMSSDQGWEIGVSNYWGNLLFQRVLKSPEFSRMLDQQIARLYGGVLAPLRVEALAGEYGAITTPYLYRMPDRLYAPLNPAQHDQVLGAVAEEIQKNYELYHESLERPMPFYIWKPVPQADGSGLSCRWDASFDLEQREITYTAEIANSISFKKKIASYTGIMTELKTPPLPPGQYFLRVSATNSDGKTQPAFNYYVTENYDKIFGVKCFYVLANGTVEELVYEEGR